MVNTGTLMMPINMGRTQRDVLRDPPIMGNPESWDLWDFQDKRTSMHKSKVTVCNIKSRDL